ncbi:MAG: DUF2971 domain-containing protein [Clostridia bacterium]|nr:DUF2971 domain-containing protein [Clostridia bacterium]
MNNYFETTFSKMVAAFEAKTIYRNENLANDIGNYPRRLYKYKNGLENHDYDMVREGYIWASTPTGFDDPTDSFVNLSIVSGDKDRIVDTIIDNHNDAIRNSIATGKINAEYFTEMTTAEILKYKQEISTQNRKYSAVKNREIINKSKDKQIKKIDKLMHSPKFKQDLSNSIETALAKTAQIFRDKCKICCLTTRKDNQKLWEDFADKYSGFVIEFDTRRCLGNVDAETALSNTFKVSYRRYLPTVSLYDIFELWFLKTVCGQDYDTTTLAENLYNQLLLKKKEYSGEEEWRVISYKNKIEFPAISAVYMGYKIIPEKEEKLKKICFEQGIPLYKQRFEKYSTKMFFALVRKEDTLNERNEK